MPKDHNLMLFKCLNIMVNFSIFFIEGFALGL